jgi:hypothetical protein
MRRAMHSACRGAAGASWVLGFMLLVSACTTFRPAAGTADELRRRILAGELLVAGDRVRLTTAEGQEHELRVDSLDLDVGTISSRRGASFPVADVVALEQRVRAPAKTWGLIGALALLILGSDCEDDPSCDLGYGGLCC